MNSFIVLILAMLALAFAVGSRLMSFLKNNGNQRVKLSCFSCVLSALFLIQLSFPLVSAIVGIEDETKLSGVSEEPEVVPFSWETYLDSSFQQSFADWYGENFGFHNYFFKAFNQIRYDVFRLNNAVVVGKDGYLFEEDYIDEVVGKKERVGMEYIDGLTKQIQTIETTLGSQGVQVVVLITPSKATYYGDYIPDRFVWGGSAEILQNPRSIDLLRENLASAGVTVIDAVEIINESQLEFPLFAKTGTHWNTPTTMIVVERLNETIAQQFPVKTVAEKIYFTSEEKRLFFLDTDILELMNVFSAETDDIYYDVDYILEEDYLLPPRVFMQGGSFLHEIRLLSSKHDLYKIAQLFYAIEMIDERNDYQYLPEPLEGGWEGFDGNLRYQLSTTDVLVLEVNENYVERMGAGFLEYLCGFLELNSVEKQYEHVFNPEKHSLFLSDFTTGIHSGGWAEQNAVIRLQNWNFADTGLYIDLEIPEALLDQQNSFTFYINNEMITTITSPAGQASIRLELQPEQIPASMWDAVYDIAIVSTNTTQVEGNDIGARIAYIGDGE